MWNILEFLIEFREFLENKATIKIEKFKQLPPLHAAASEGNISDVRIYSKVSIKQLRHVLYNGLKKLDKRIVRIAW